MANTTAYRDSAARVDVTLPSGPPTLTHDAAAELLALLLDAQNALMAQEITRPDAA
jgi:hypothetical protein